MVHLPFNACSGVFVKIFGGELYTKSLPAFQLFCEIILNFQVIVISIKDAVNNQQD